MGVGGVAYCDQIWLGGSGRLRKRDVHSSYNKFYKFYILLQTLIKLLKYLLLQAINIKIRELLLITIIYHIREGGSIICLT